MTSLIGAHKFLGNVVCNVCGHKAPDTKEGRASIRKHIREAHREHA